jgi:hypothetical protein
MRANFRLSTPHVYLPWVLACSLSSLLNFEAAPRSLFALVCSPLGRRMLWLSVFLIIPLNPFQFLLRFSHCAKVNFSSTCKQSINLLVWSNNRGSNENSAVISSPKGFLGRILPIHEHLGRYFGLVNSMHSLVAAVVTGEHHCGIKLPEIPQPFSYCSCSAKNRRQHNSTHEKIAESLRQGWIISVVKVHKRYF